MSKRITGAFELLLLAVVVITLFLGVGWVGSSAAQSSPAAHPQQAPVAPSATPASQAVPTATAPAGPTPTPAGPALAPTQTVTASAWAMPTAVATPEPFNPQTEIDANDAPLLVQAPGTMNVLLIGSDASANENLARTDTLIIVSINPEMPSVSMLSLPRDLIVRIPGHGEDRINTAFEYGYILEYPGGGPAMLATVLRKNFGIKIDHFLRVDFAGFVKAVDTLGGVEVLAECELHDTFPDKSSPTGKTDLDVYPGKVELGGKQALWYSRSRWSTTDFDRARRQQKVLRALFSKAKHSDLLGNALTLYNDFRENVQTSIGITDIPYFVDIATRLDNLAMKSRVVTFPIVKAFTRSDGARVLVPTSDTIPYIAESLSPPAGNRAVNLARVEVINASQRPDMELVAAERLAWEGFQVTSATIAETRDKEKTEIVDFSVTTKGSPIPRLSSIFRVRQTQITAQPDPSSQVAAQIILGDDYNSCPQTATIAGDVPLAATATPEAGDGEPTPTPAP